MARLRLFGHPTLESDQTRKALGLPAKALAAIALVAANAGRPVSRDWLAQVLWPDSDPSEARTNLRRQIHLALKALDEDAFVLTRQTIAWNSDGPVAADVVNFDKLRLTDPAAAAEEYAGELCAGIADESLDDARLRYRWRYEHLLRTLFEDARRANDDASMRLSLQRLIAYDPLDEQSVREMMRLRIQNGDRSGALRDYTALRGRLLSELGVEPQPETAELFAEILAQNDSPVTPNNLTAATTSFVGREGELAEIAAALAESRIVTLVGPGGIGKSRLALRACFDLLPSYSDGVWFVDLEHAKSQAHVWERIADAAHVPVTDPRERAVLAHLRERAALVVLDTCEHVADAARAVAESLTEHTPVRVLATSRKRLNCAQARELGVQALDIPPAQMVNGDSPLRYSAYRLFVERAALANPAFRIEPHNLEALSALLRSVDGLPLAIELVASRANALSIDGLRRRVAQAVRSARTGDGHGRSRTLEATLAWSYDMLSASQRATFERLSVFRGAFSGEDAERVCNEIPNALEALFQLVDASLVSVITETHDVRYRLLETTRTFASARLAQSGDLEPVLLAHAQCLAAKADALASAPETEFAAILPSLSEHIADYLSALENAASRTWAPLGQRILDGLYRFALGHHFTREILERAQALLAGTELTPTQRAAVARQASSLADTCQRYDLAIEYGTAALNHARETGDEALVCSALAGIAGTRFHQGRITECEALLVDVCDRLRRMGDQKRLLRMTARLGTLYVTRDYQKSVDFLAPAAEQLFGIGEVRQAGYALRNLTAAAYVVERYGDAAVWAARGLEYARASSDLALELNLATALGSSLQLCGRTHEAFAPLVDACSIVTRLGEGTEVADSLEDIGATLASLGVLETAARLAGLSDRIRRSMGTPMDPEMTVHYRRTLERVRTRLGPAFGEWFQRGARDTVEQAAGYSRQTLLRLQEAFARDNEDTTSLS